MKVKGDDSVATAVAMPKGPLRSGRVVTPEVVAAEMPSAKPGGRGRRGKINRLPAAIKAELDERIASGAFEYRELAEWLAEKHPSEPMSFSTLNYYVKFKCDPGLWAIKMATHQALEIVKAVGGKDDEMNHALTRLIQTVMFELLVEMNKARRLLKLFEIARRRGDSVIRKRIERQKKAEKKSGKKPGRKTAKKKAQALLDADGQYVPRYPSRAEVAVVAAFGRVTALLSKQTLDWTKWRRYVAEDIRKKVEVAATELAVAADGGGLSVKAAEQIRSALMDIHV